MVNKLIYKYHDKCNFVYDGTKVNLPEEIVKNIEKNWDEIIATGKPVTNGELFTINDIFMDNDGMLNFDVKKTNYAHFLYSVKNKFEGDYLCRSMAANVLPITTDNHFVLGVMDNWTVIPNSIKFIGGAMSIGDLFDNRLEPLNCARREMLEEIGIDIDDRKYVTSYEPIYFLTRKNLSFINVLYLVHLNLSSDELQGKFKEHKAYLAENKLEDELNSILLVKNDLVSNRLFIDNNRDRLIEYMESLFDVMYGIEEAKDIVNEI